MNHEHQSDQKPFLRSPVGIALIGFLAVVAFVLIAEHRAHIFTGTWFIWLLPLVCVVMHFFHGGHGEGHDHSGSQSKDR
jgi:heme/copper-type cytochrome/quinol oxidase subunit 4